jgi:hypothetical protein
MKTNPGKPEGVETVQRKARWLDRMVRRFHQIPTETILIMTVVVMGLNCLVSAYSICASRFGQKPGGPTTVMQPPEPAMQSGGSSDESQTPAGPVSRGVETESPDDQLIPYEQPRAQLPSRHRNTPGTSDELIQSRSWRATPSNDPGEAQRPGAPPRLEQ